MLRNLWVSSSIAAKELEINEIDLSNMREGGFLKPGIHWKSSPYGQMKPWKPEALYNVKQCKKLIIKDQFIKQFHINAA